MDTDRLYSDFLLLDQKDAKSKLDNFSLMYYNSTNVITDEQFDTLLNLYENKFNTTYDVVGAPPPTGAKIVKLPYPLYSLNKIKSGKKEDLKKIETWIHKYSTPEEFIVSDKVDGVSGLYVVRHVGETVIRNLYTRGDGIKGTDITNLLKYLVLPIPDYDIAVRGEIILPDRAFDDYRLEAFKIGTKNKLNSSRNLTSGIVNACSIKDSDTFDPDLAKQLNFLAYRIVDWEYKDINQEKQYEYLEDIGFTIPWFQRVEEISIEILENLLTLRREPGEYKAPYLIDGLVVSQNEVVKHPDDKNPLHMFAFKFDTISTVSVTSVVWRPQKDGKLIPVIYYDKVHLSGADCIKATGHNAKRIIDWQIGPGAKIMITRSSEVIPFVVCCISPCESWDMPNFPEDEWGWSETEVDFILLDPDSNPDVQMKKIHYFFKHMDVKNIGEKRAQDFFEAGFETIKSIIEATKKELCNVIGDANGAKVYEDLHDKLTNADLAAVMTSSGIFGPGFGDRKLLAIVDAYPNILDYSSEDEEFIVAKLFEIGGFNKMAYIFADRLPIFKNWLDALPMIRIGKKKKFMSPSKLSPEKVVHTEVTSDLKGQTIVFTGFRDKELELQIVESGGKVTSAISGKTTLVIIKDVSQMKGKALKAQDNGIKILTLENFCTIYHFVTSR
jgi:DNA ligase (NAD+)